MKTQPHQKHGPKYAYFDELSPYLERGQSLVVYHHIGRNGSAMEQIQTRLAQIKDRLNTDALALLYHRGSARVYFILPAEKHQDVISNRVGRFLDSSWKLHFEAVHVAS